MPLDADLLDPSVDLPDYLQGVYSDIAKQRGGKTAKAQTYSTLAKQGMSPTDVLAKSYDEQEKRQQEQLASTMPGQYDIRTDPNFFFDAHTVNVQDPSMGFMKSSGGDTGVAPNPPATAPIVTPAEIDTTKLQEIQKQINDVFSKPHPIWEGSPMPQPTSSQALLTGLAMAFAPPNQSGQILNALTGNLQAIRQRNDVIHLLWQQSQDATDKQQLEALMKQATIEESRAFHQATLKQQADVTNANNQRAITTNENTVQGGIKKAEIGADQKTLERQSKLRHDALFGKSPELRKIAHDQYYRETGTDLGDVTALTPQEQSQTARADNLNYDLSFKQLTEPDRVAKLKSEVQAIDHRILLTDAQTKVANENAKVIGPKAAAYIEAMHNLIDTRNSADQRAWEQFGLTKDKADLEIDKAFEVARREAQKHVDSAVADWSYYSQLLKDNIDEQGKPLDENTKKLYQAKIDDARTKAVRAGAQVMDAQKKIDDARSKVQNSGGVGILDRAKNAVKGLTGRLNRNQLKKTVSGVQMVPEAADAWDRMVAAAQADGVHLGATDGYRDYDTQVRLKKEKPNLAATPGRSKHGLGIAADVNGGDKAIAWLDKNGSRFGWHNPIRHKEPWHWEFSGTQNTNGGIKAENDNPYLADFT